MTLDDLAALLDFHYWARDRVLDAAATLTPEQFTHVIGGSFPTVRETLVHMYWADWAWYQIWHGTYHRGQVTMMLRQLGAEPPQSTDLIRYYRERAAVTSGRV